MEVGGKWQEMKRLKGEEEGFTRLASFVCDCGEPFSEEQLEAIEATFQSSLPKLKPNNNNNNNKRPFNARRLPRSLLALQHPNAKAFSFSSSQGYSRMKLPVMKFSGQIMYSRTFSDVEKAATKLLKILEEKKKETMQIAIGLDIEWKPSFRKGVPPGKVAVMQIYGGTSHCHVLHLIHSGIPQNLQLLLEDPTVLKVGAGIGGDAVKVFRDYNISIKGVEDLSFNANRKLGGGPHKWGLGSLTEKLLSKQLKKPSQIRMGNWETPVLSKEQLEYAATDAFASWYLHQAIKDLPDAQEITDKSGEVDGVPQQ
ncbi:3'-5' exonuclease-like [Gastrolobium bilobum]|uniref:3'-5' exonuclease-like n=1 Tax=Gastrolobium bilobum TaxID=150636 RepID=UPI002AB181F4|nr:3'-5' exonuclease-like [Gastrolobium bilobum]